MNIQKSLLPDNSILKKNGKKYDYVDSFQGDFSTKTAHISPTEVGKTFFSSSPKWIDSLFEIRNKIVGLVGLKTSGNISNRQQMLANFKCEESEQMGLFKVFNKTENEVILGEDDKHLNFRVSLFIDNQTNENNKKLTISTTVEFNNWFGKLYFLPVRPFHKIIVPRMLKGIISELDKKESI